MKRVDVLSVAWLALAIGLTSWIGLDRTRTTHAQVAREKLAAGAQYGELPSGERGVVDANGVLVPVRPYQRIATMSTPSDALGLALLEPERLVAMSNYGRRHHEAPYLYGERMDVVGPQQLEMLVQQRIELLVINHLGSASELARARESGIQVFNLGEMRGLTTLLPNIAAFSALIGEPERGEAFARKLVRRMHAVAADIPASERKTAIYVSSYANQLFGGSTGTSYHDVLLGAGLRDSAAEHGYTGWMHFDPERLVELDPELVIAHDGTGQALCRVGGLEHLRACQHGGVIELSMELLSDPGPRMLEAAEALRDRAYGPP
ncbi:MAG TPA: ABC transporter substrate-binding protein [Polyangiales bacterium]|nr:ABC transporter substrate-binding protein [Polyangiales bacterium]